MIISKYWNLLYIVELKMSKNIVFFWNLIYNDFNFKR